MIQALLAGGQIGMGVLGSQQAKKAASKARKEQRAYLAQALGTLDRLSAMYRPGSDYGQSLFKDLKTQGEFEVGKTLQQRLMSGVGGTTYGNVYGQYQQNVGRQERRKLEDYLSDKYAGVQQQKAALLSGVQVSGPSGSDIAGSASQIGQGLGTLAGLFGGGNQKDDAFKAQLKMATQKPTPIVNTKPSLYKRFMGMFK